MLEIPATRWPKAAKPSDLRLVKSASRVLQILEFLDDLKRHSTVTEISEALAIPQSSTSALLRSMVSMGYLVYDRYRRTYLTSSRVALLGNWVNEPFFADGRIISAMRALYSSTQATVVLAMRNGMQVQYIHILRAPVTEPLNFPVGYAAPLPTCAAGLAILSIAGDDDVVRVVRRHNAETVDSENRIQISALRERLADFRRDQFARLYGSPIEKVGMLAAPLGQIEGQCPMAIGISARRDVLAEREAAFATALVEQIRGLNLVPDVKSKVNWSPALAM